MRLGQPGEEVSLQLILRVVTDVGLVGLPNAGNSTLLAATTFAKPDYPFTTLMPNLGRFDGDPNLGAGKYSSEATLADLPGLIKGAHLGNGIGSNFLRHLRRTRLLVHVVNAAAEYLVNPDYLVRPSVVVLNKIDFFESFKGLASLTQEIQRVGSDKITAQIETNSDDTHHSFSADKDCTYDLSSEICDEDRRVKEIEEYPRLLVVMGVSVLKGTNIIQMLKDVARYNRQELELACEDFSNIVGSISDSLVYKGIIKGGPEIAVIFLRIKEEHWKTIISRSEKNYGAISTEGAVCVIPISLEGCHLDVQGKIYAFGVFLLELIRGRPQNCKDKGYYGKVLVPAL